MDENKQENNLFVFGVITNKNFPHNPTEKCLIDPKKIWLYLYLKRKKMNKEQIQTINWYRKNKNLVEGLTKDELSVLKENLGEYFDYIFKSEYLSIQKSPK